MNLVTGDMIWTNINKIPNPYPYLHDDIACDVVIVGGGITGAICAYYFTKLGIKTVLVDKNIIGYGSTSASTSILQYEIDKDLIGLKGLIGIENAVKTFKLCQKAVYDVEKIVKELEDDCDFRLKECFYYSDKESDVDYFKKEFELRKTNDFDVELIDQKKGIERFSFPIKVGIYSKSGAAEIDPYRFTHGLIASSVKKGLKVFENTEIIEILPKREEIELLTKNRFKIQAKKAIIASGFEGKKYIHKKTAILTRSFTIATKPLKHFDGWYNQCIIRDNNTPYTYIRSTGDNRMIVGGEDLDVGGERSKITNLTNDDLVSIQKFKRLKEKIISMFPNIKNIDIDYNFSGFFGESKDNLPFIGEYAAYPNCYFCLGYGSNGILYAILGGQLLSRLYLENDVSELNLFKVDR